MKRYSCECDRCIFHKDTGYGKESFEYCDLAKTIKDVKLSKINEIFEGTIGHPHCPFFKEDYDYEKILKKALEEVNQSQIDEIIEANKKTPIKGEYKVNANFEFLKNTLTELHKTVDEASQKFQVKIAKEIKKEQTNHLKSKFDKMLTKLKFDEFRCKNCEKLAKDIIELVGKEDLKDDRL